MTQFRMGEISTLQSKHMVVLLRLLLLCGLLLGARLAPGAEEAPDAGGTPASSTGTTRIHVTCTRQVFAPSQRLYQFYGAVKAEIRQSTLTADELVYDAGRELVTASGSVTISENGRSYRGETLEYELRTGAWRFREWQADVPAPSLDASLTGSVFLHGDEVQQEGNALHAADTLVTTCDLADPHYALEAAEVDIYPGQRLIAHKVALYVLGRKIAQLPWFFLPLNGDRAFLLPEVGENAVEGYFSRFPYQYVVNGQQAGILRLDVTSKRGLGLAVDHFYGLPGGQGEAYLYGSLGSGDYTVRLQHEQRLPADIDGHVTVEQQRSTAYSTTPVTTTSINSWMTRNTTHTNTNAAVTYSGTDSAASQQGSTNVTLRHDIKLGSDTIDYSARYYSSNFSYADGQNTTQELDNHLQWTRKLGVGDLQLRVDHSALAGDALNSGGYFPELQRLPEITFQTDGTRLGLKALQNVPVSLSLGWGRYRESDGQDPFNRMTFGLQMAPKTLQLGNTALTAHSEFRQMLYDTDELTAQYDTRAGLTAVTHAGPFSNTFNYDFERNAGYSPLRTDAFYPQHTVTDRLQLDTPALKFTLSGGRDLLWDRWQDLSLYAEAHPFTRLTVQGSLGYDLNDHQWRNLISRINWQASDRLYLGLDTRYDIESRKLSSVGTQLQWAISPQWRVEWNGYYDGTGGWFSTNRWLVTRDLHCWEASFYADLAAKSFGFTLRPKVLGDMLLPQFSLGQGSGQYEAGVGVAF